MYVSVCTIRYLHRSNGCIFLAAMLARKAISAEGCCSIGKKGSPALLSIIMRTGLFLSKQKIKLSHLVTNCPVPQLL